MIETRLRDELHTVAQHLQVPPPPDTADLTRSAGRTRTMARLRGAATAGLVAAAVAATVIVVGQNDGSTEPTPAPALPASLRDGEPPHVPYLVKKTLHVGGYTKDDYWRDLAVAGDSAVATLYIGNKTIVTLVVFRDGHETERIRNVSSQQESVVSPDGTKLAYVELGAADAHLVVRDLVDGVEVGRIAVDRGNVGNLGEESEAWERVFQVTDGGTVSYGSVAVQHTWTPGSEPVDESPAPRRDLSPGFPPDAGRVTLSADGGWGTWITAADGGPASGDSGYGLAVQRPEEPGTRYDFGLPEGTRVHTVFWESETDVLALADPGRGPADFIRCSVVTRSCENARAEPR